MSQRAESDPKDRFSTDAAGLVEGLRPAVIRLLDAKDSDAELRAAELSLVTTEHFALQGARSATIAESTGRAHVFLGAVSGGLVALGLVATATSVGAAFTALGLVLLPTPLFPRSGYLRAGSAVGHRGPLLRTAHRSAARL